MRLVFSTLFIFLSFSQMTWAQGSYWQQRVDYDMTIDFNVNNHQFNGNQSLTYFNNSTDTLKKVFYHLYFNAFQPGSSMDVRSRTISDPDPRIADRIQSLNEDEIGFHKISKLTQDGKKVEFKIEGTLMTVVLNDLLLPGTSSKFDMEFKSQVPVQIRRSGRDNKESVDYTMTQWYPKMAEYDIDGWHTDPYVCREFHGVFGTFDVTINIDNSYIIGGTGVLRSDPIIEKSNVTNEWQFHAENVHDFAWAADPDFVQSKLSTPSGTELNFYHLNDTILADNWSRLEDETIELFEIMNDKFGVYPYEQFSVIQAGDGGMEYPMCTMISGTGSFGGLVSVTVHEAIHNWYYGVLATNELKYPWMDEGFTTFAQNIVLDSLRKSRKDNPHQRSYDSYSRYVSKRSEEPLTTHADHYDYNSSYGVASYSKGCVFLSQLEYIIGEEAFSIGMKRYFNEWKFKHPTPTDFKRVMEKASDIELDWYFEGWIGTTKQIDYAISSVVPQGSKTEIIIEKHGGLSMPLEITVIANGSETTYYIPVERMRSIKPHDNSTLMKTWPWAYPSYTLILDNRITDIESITIDPQNRMADADRSQNVYPRAKTNTTVEP